MRKMEQPRFTDANLLACGMQPWISVFVIGGISAVDWVACQMPSLEANSTPEAIEAL